MCIGAVHPEKNDNGAYDNLPEDVKILPEQISENAITVVLLAAYNNTLPTFNITETKADGGNLIIKVYSSESMQGRENMTMATAYATFANLSCGNYSISLLDNSTGDVIARENCTIKQMGEFLNDDKMKGVLGTYKGGMDNGTMYLMPFPTVPVCPPGISKDTSFWANSSDSFYLSLNLTNKDLNRSDVEVTLESTEDGIDITPGRAYIGSLNSSSSAFCIFQIGTENISHGIYNLAYNISFREDGDERSLKGVIPMGIYEKQEHCHEDDAGNITANVKLITPFSDYYNYTASGWIGLNVSVSSIDQTIWLPTITQMEMNLSNYTRQEPHSPMPLFLVGAVAGGVICGGATALEQWMAKKPIDWNEVGSNAVKGAVGGAVIGATFGYAAGPTAATAAKIGLTGTGLLKSMVLPTVTSTVLKTTNEWATAGKVSWANVITNGVVSAAESSFYYGVGQLAGALTPAISHTMGGGGVGKWAPVSRLVKEGHLIKAAVKYNSMATYLAPQIFRQVKSGYDTTRGLIKLYGAFKSPSFKFITSHPNELKSGIKIMFEPLLKPPRSDMLNHEGPEGSDISDIGSLTGEDRSGSSSASPSTTPSITPPPGSTQVMVNIWIHCSDKPNLPAKGTKVTAIDGAGNAIQVELDSNGKATVYGAPGTWTITAKATMYKSNPWSMEVPIGSVGDADIYQKFSPPIWIEGSQVAGVGTLV